MRIETVIIYVKAFAALGLLWWLSRSFVGVWGREGITAFLSSALVFDTTISVRKLQSFLTERIERHIQTYYRRCRAERVSQRSARAMQKNADCLKARFQQMTRPASVVCPVFGMAASVCILALFLTGVPKSLDSFVILAAYPAFLYYSVLVIAYAAVYVQLNGSFMDRRSRAKAKSVLFDETAEEAAIDSFAEAAKKE